MIGKIISAAIALLYIIWAYLSQDFETIAAMLLGVLLALGLIWYGDEIGSATLPVDLGMNYLNLSNATPGGLIKFMGWVFLLFPFIILGIGYLVAAK